MRDINLPDSPQDARGRDHEAGLAHRAAIHERRRITGNENEDFGGVAESVVADREPGQKIGRQMINKDQPQGKPAEQVEPQFALPGCRQRDRGCSRRERDIARDRARVSGERRSGNSIGY